VTTHSTLHLKRIRKPYLSLATKNGKKIKGSIEEKYNRKLILNQMKANVNLNDSTLSGVSSTININNQYSSVGNPVKKKSYSPGRKD
jgi:hypothetical protein